MKTWREMLAANYHHEDAGSSWTSISSLPSLEKCSFYAGRPGSSDKAQRGLALHSIMAGAPMPDDIPAYERECIKEAHHKTNELCYHAGISPVELLREQRVSNARLRIIGTADVLHAKNGHVVVADYKFGSDEVELNSAQLAGYSVCASLDGSDKVLRAVIQPGFPMAIMRSTIWKDMERVESILNKRERKNNDNCGYCAHAATCPLMQGIQTAEWKAQSIAELSLALEWAERVSIADKAASAYREQAKEKMRAGEVMPGWKLRTSQVREISDLVSLYDMAKAVGVDDKTFLRACKTTLKAAKEALPQLSEAHLAACTTTSERVSLVRA